METQTSLMFKKMIAPEFSWKGLQDYNLLVGLAQEAVTLKDLPQRILGKIAIQLKADKTNTMRQFSKDIGVSIHVLQIYSWVERRLDGLEIPEDIPWSALRIIAGADDPKKWVDRVVKEGLSFAEVKYLVYKEKGIEPKHAHQKIKCPKCSFITESVKCEGCGTVI